MNQSHCETNDSSAACIAVKRDDDNTRFIVAELLDLLNDSRSQQDTAIITEIIKTVHLLVKEGGNRREEIIGHPQVSSFASGEIDGKHRRLLFSFWSSYQNSSTVIIISRGYSPVSFTICPPMKTGFDYYWQRASCRCLFIRSRKTRRKAKPTNRWKLFVDRRMTT